MKYITALALIFVSTPAITGPFYNPEQWAQVDPADREWLRTQKVPGQGYKCCDESDGTYAEEFIGTSSPDVQPQPIGPESHYWTRFTWHHYDYTTTPPTLIEKQHDWMQVPDEAVIHDANRHGAPVVWWAWQGGENVFIRCYAPGGGF